MNKKPPAEIGTDEIVKRFSSMTPGSNSEILKWELNNPFKAKPLDAVLKILNNIDPKNNNKNRR